MTGLDPHQHPLREALADEVHARPVQPLRPPARASYLVMVSSEDAVAADIAHLAALTDLFGAPPPTPDTRHYVANLGSFRLRWERHTEFCTYLLITEEAVSRADPFEEPVIQMLPREWLTTLPGQLLVALHLGIETDEGRDPSRLAVLFEGHELVGSRVDDGQALVWTDFRIHGDGYSRLLIQDLGLTPSSLGRLVRRLIEIETYRMMALLAFPLARETGPKVRKLEATLERMTARMNDPQDRTADSVYLDELSNLAVAAEALAATTSYRFSAAKAYFDLVETRLGELREDRFPNSQTLREFLERRLLPAVNTCVSVEQRLNAFSARLARAGQWLHTRVGIAVENQNVGLLSSLEQHVRLQVKLQETVEGFSTVAISYYLLSLAGYVVRGAEQIGLPIQPAILLGVAAPLIFLGVMVGVYRLKRKLLP